MAFRRKDKELPEEYKETRNLAAMDLLAGEYQKALEVYKDLLEVAPDNGKLWLEYTHTLLGLERKEDAKHAYERVKKLLRKEESVFGVGNTNTMVEFGILLSEEGDIETAEEIFRAATKQTPDLYRAWFYLANLYKSKKDFVKAEEILREGLDVTIDHRDRVMLGLAEVLSLQSKFTEGLEMRRQAIIANPNSIEAWLSFAVDSYQFGDYDEAEEALSKTMKLSEENQSMLNTIEQTVMMLEDHLKKCPKNMDESDFHFSVGMFHYQNQDYGKARDSMKRAIRYREKNAQAWAILGGSLVQLKDLHQAEKACKIALKYDQKNIAAYLALAGLYAMRGDMDGTISSLKQGLQMNPGESTLTKMLADAKKAQAGDIVISQEMVDAEESKRQGLTLLNLGDMKKALKALKKSIKFNPTDAEVWSLIGLIFVNMKKFKDGEEAARKAIKLDEKNAVAWGVLGAALGDAGKKEEAEEAYQKAIELDPENVSNLLPLGFLHLEKGDLDAAEKLFEKSVNLRPKSSVVWQMLAQVYLLKNKAKEATEALENADRYARLGS